MKQSTYLADGKYKCECGREFEKSQSLNAHFSRCKIHRGDSYVARKGDPFRNLSPERRREIFSKRDEKLRNKILSKTHKKNISEALRRTERKENSEWGGYREGTNKWRGGYEVDSFGNKVWLDSSYEIRFVKTLNRLGIEWAKNRQKFSYEYQGKKKNYTPDFFIENTWIEVKGWEKDIDRAKWKQFPHRLKVIRKEDLSKIENIESKEALVAELVYAHG